MIADNKVIYNNISLRYPDLDQNIVKSIGNFIFKSLSDYIKDPDNLILNIQGFGRLIARKSKTELQYNNLLKKFFDEEGNIINIDESKEWAEEKKQKIKNSKRVFESILSKYDSFLTEKKKYKILRYGNLESNI